ncbi:MAG: hypothetical protein ABR863_07975 [Roseiarcus sp.]
MAFSHPLARGAKVWAEKTLDGEDRRVLVVVTTIALDPGAKGFKKRLVENLSRAAQEYLAASPEAAGFVLINRMRDWVAKSS